MVTLCSNSVWKSIVLKLWMYKINFQSCISRLLRLLQHNRVIKPGKSLLVTVTNVVVYGEWKSGTLHFCSQATCKGFYNVKLGLVLTVKLNSKRCCVWNSTFKLDAMTKSKASLHICSQNVLHLSSKLTSSSLNTHSSQHVQTIDFTTILTLDSHVSCGIHCWCRWVNSWPAGILSSMRCAQRAEWEGEGGGWASGSLSLHCDVTLIGHSRTITGIQPLNS